MDYFKYVEYGYTREREKEGLTVRGYYETKWTRLDELWGNVNVETLYSKKSKFTTVF